MSEESYFSTALKQLESLEIFHKNNHWFNDKDYSEWAVGFSDTLKKALRIADTVQQGKVSDEMLECGYSAGDGCTYVRSVYKAMTKQMIDELTNE